MKKIYILTGILIGLLTFTACDDEFDDYEIYKKIVYIIDSEYTSYTFEHPFQDEPSEGFITVYCSGSQQTDQTIAIEMEEVDSLIKAYNYIEYEYDSAKYVKALPKDHYRISDMTLQLREGQPFVRMPIYVKTKGLSADQTYVIPLRIKNASGLEINPDLSSVLYTITFKNKYSGPYKMSGTKTLSDGTGSAQEVFTNKKLVAIDEHTVRCYIATETEDENTRYTQTMTFRLGENNAVVINSYNVIDLGGSTYDPEKKVFRLNYRYLDSDALIYYDMKETLTYDEKK